MHNACGSPPVGPTWTSDSTSQNPTWHLPSKASQFSCVFFCLFVVNGYLIAQTRNSDSRFPLPCVECISQSFRGLSQWLSHLALHSVSTNKPRDLSPRLSSPLMAQCSSSPSWRGYPAFSVKSDFFSRRAKPSLAWLLSLPHLTTAPRGLCADSCSNSVLDCHALWCHFLAMPSGEPPAFRPTAVLCVPTKGMAHCDTTVLLLCLHLVPGLLEGSEYISPPPPRPAQCPEWSAQAHRQHASSSVMQGLLGCHFCLFKGRDL